MEYLKEDIRANDLFLIHSFWSPALILNIYLLFILDVGPKFMETRPAYNLKKLIIVYNIIQIALNIWLFIRTVKLVIGINPICGPIENNLDTKNLNMVQLFHHYYLLKISDLLDTVFFVLRKKSNQVSKLHIYHHVCVLLVSWGGTRYYPGGQGIYIHLVNTFVHIIMYFYYLLTSFHSAYTVWWKKYITQIQILQHVGVTLIFLLSLLNPTCSYPKFACLVVIPNGIAMFWLFTNFYKRHYLSESIKQQ